jgi:predicted ribosomally synthesized peptide with SipW-like signal peptide
MLTKRTTTRLALSALAVCATAALVGTATFSAFSATVDSAGNSMQAGTVVLADNAPGSSLFALGPMKPGDGAAKCVRVAYTGSLPSSVRLYSTRTNTTGDLSPYLSTVITRGSFPGAPPADNSCAGFVADGSDSLLLDDKLGALPTAYAGGLIDPDGAWTAGESAVYRIQVTQDDVDAAQGRDVQLTLRWEARNN